MLGLRLPLYLQPRMLLMFALGFGSGLPLLLTGSTLLAWLVGVGVPTAQLGLFSLCSLPYSLKLLWAPLLDRVAPLPQLGRRRGWMLGAQLLLVAAIAALGSADPVRRPRTPEHALVDLRLLCKDVAQSVEPVAAKYGVVVADESRANTAPLWAEGDAGQLRQAVLNLALNAIEASQEGDRVSIRAYETQDRDATARVVEVSDTGSGIDPDQLAQIFQPFFTTKPTGTGLGLAVADNIVKGHNGRMTVESAENRGTTFRILLPSAVTRAMELPA